MKSADCHGLAGLENMPIVLALLISSASIVVACDKASETAKGARGKEASVTKTDGMK